MKEQLKKLDNDAKLSVYVEEGRSQPIKIELPLSFAQNKDDFCKRQLFILRVIVLLAILALLCWTAIILYTNSHPRTILVIDNKMSVNINKSNELDANKSEVYERSDKNPGSNYVGISESVSKTSQDEEPMEVDSSFKAESDTNLTKNVKQLAMNAEEPEKEVIGEKSHDESQIEMVAKKGVFFDEWLSSLGAIHLLEKNQNPKMYADFDKMVEISEISFCRFDEEEEEEDAEDMPYIVSQQRLKEIENEDTRTMGEIMEYIDIFQPGVNDLSVFRQSVTSEIEKQMKEVEDKFKDASDDVSHIYKEKPTLNEDSIVPEMRSQEKTYSQENVSQERNSSEGIKSIRKNGAKEMYGLMARQLEKRLGNYADLLVWYYKNRNNPEWTNVNDRLKVYAAIMLYGTNIENFHRDYLSVLIFIMDNEFISEYEKLKDATQKIETESYTQTYIINRVEIKIDIDSLLVQEEADPELVVEAIEIVNRLELRSYGVDPDDLFLESSKNANEEAFPEKSHKDSDESEMEEQEEPSQTTVAEFEEK